MARSRWCAVVSSIGRQNFRSTWHSLRSSRSPPDSLVAGGNTLVCNVTTANGMQLTKVAGLVDVKDPAKWSRIVLPIYGSVQAYGTPTINVEVADHGASALLDVRPIKA